MITLTQLYQWTGTHSCYACGRKGAVRVMAVNPQNGDTSSLVLCAGCETTLVKKLDKRKQASALKQLGISSKPWKPGHE